MSVDADKLVLAIGRVVKKLRRFHDLTQEQLASAANTDTNFISAIERGKRQPSAHKIFMLASAFNLEPSKFVELVQSELEGKPIVSLGS